MSQRCKTKTKNIVSSMVKEKTNKKPPKYTDNTKKNRRAYGKDPDVTQKIEW